MQMELEDMSGNLRIVGMSVFVALVWLLLGMVYLDRFPQSLERVELALMPWRQPMPTEANLDQRLALMQGQLDAATRIASLAFAATIVSFAALSAYLSILYQQKQRRSRENMFLLLKNREIARRNEFIRYISATIGHEFKNNLGRIKRRIDLLDAVHREARSRIDDNFDKLFADIDIFKRISDEREAGLIEFSHVDLKKMLDELSRQYGDLAEISFHENVALPRIYAAPPLVRTVFENVLDNAVKYKKPEQPRAKITLSCSMDRDGSRRYMTVSLRDEGVGMTEQLADRCFYAGRGSGSGESWGRGLYYAKYVVGLHAGKIRVGKEYTAPGTGTEIIVNLPFVEESLDV